jgi:hypothetical protein
MVIYAELASHINVDQCTNECLPFSALSAGNATDRLEDKPSQRHAVFFFAFQCCTDFSPEKASVITNYCAAESRSQAV